MKPRTPEQIAQCAAGELIVFLDFPEGTEGPIRERLVPIEEIPEDGGPRGIMARPKSRPRVRRRQGKRVGGVGRNRESEGLWSGQPRGSISKPPLGALTPAELVRRYPKAARKAGIR